MAVQRHPQLAAYPVHQGDIEGSLRGGGVVGVPDGAGVVGAGDVFFAEVADGEEGVEAEFHGVAADFAVLKDGSFPATVAEGAAVATAVEKGMGD